MAVHLLSQSPTDEPCKKEKAFLPSQSLKRSRSFSLKGFLEALEIFPFTLRDFSPRLLAVAWNGFRGEGAQSYLLVLSASGIPQALCLLKSEDGLSTR
jgi:hypothetical protein